MDRRSLKVISLLLVESTASLRDPISLLDPLPLGDKLRNARQIQHKLKYANGQFSLKQEIIHFLCVGSQRSQSGSCEVSDRSEGLKFLRKQLVEGKQQLTELLKRCQDCPDENENELLQLVLELVHLAKSSSPGVREEAAMCLGEIGPVDLNVIALRGPVHKSSSLTCALEQYEGQPNLQMYCHIFHLLDQYLIHESIDLVCAASEVLKRLLSTQTGILFYKDYKTRITDHLFQYLHPFRSNRKKATTLPDEDCSETQFKNSIGAEELWVPEHGDHEKWVRLITTKLIASGGVRDEILRLLTPICQVQAGFCEKVLPYLIHNILLKNDESEFHRKLLSEQLNLFFARHCGIGSKGRSRSTTPLVTYAECDNPVYSRKDSVETILSVVQYLRLQDKPTQGRGKESTAWDNNFWLDIDYLSAATAAYSCHKYFTAVLYVDIWCNVQREEKHSGKAEGSQRGSQGSQRSQVLEQFSQNSQLEGISEPTVSLQVQDLLLSVYRGIGAPDAVYGCGGGRLTDTHARIKTYEHEGQWGKAMSAYDVLVSGDSSDAELQYGLVQSLQNLGTSHLLKTYLKGAEGVCEGNMSDIRDIQYQLALQNCDWGLNTHSRLDSQSGFYQSLYSSAMSLRDSDITTAKLGLQRARSVSLGILQDSSLESTQGLYHCLSQLQCVNILDQTGRLIDRSVSVGDFLSQSSLEEKLLNNRFNVTECVRKQRCVALRLASQVIGDRGQKAKVSQSLVTELENLARAAREAGRHQLAERSLHELRGLEGTEAEHGWSWRVEEAKLYWARGEANTAKHLIREIAGKMAKEKDSSREVNDWYPQTLGLLGDWLAETRSEHPSVVMDDYLIKAVELIEASPTINKDTAVDAYMSLARYADVQYQRIVNYMKSPEYEAKQALIRQAKQDAENLKRMGDNSTGRYQRLLEKQRIIDETESETMTEERERFLMCAVKNSLACLECGDRHDLRAFRLTSLWFHNSQGQQVNMTMKLYLPRIPSYKFLQLMYQLAARMTAGSPTSQVAELFTTTLHSLIERITLDHPHHSLFIILALAHANKDQEVLTSRSSKKASGRLSRAAANSQEAAGDEDRVLAAKTMIERLKQTQIGQIIRDLESLCMAYIQLAYFDVEQYKKETKAMKLPSSLAITQLGELATVAMPTLPTPIDPSCQYRDVTHVLGFEPTFKLAGGINLPKIISCRGSDGVSRRQLVKGKDDLRQDAVMQQVFGMVNNLLHKEPETRRRKLTVRTYRVIPLSQRSGLLEWCEGTVPIGEYLIGSNGAHQRYRPTDLRAVQCRGLLNDAHQGKTSSKIKAFLEACQKFQPVLRHFFHEKFPDPADWYQRQLHYTRSVATNSIVGYILGLGDRHVQNILIDCHTAELVHIDLGVAFEQGRILPTPETVPFRLTRDIVDGMGVGGVEGVFRRCCEKTMSVMRCHQEVLLTILQVLLYDPLYAWTISPEKALLLQQRRDPDATDINMTTGDLLDTIDNGPQASPAEDSVNQVAERVLLRLQQKLQGLEDGGQLSVSGQVNHLIQDARDPENLCRLFPGWQPYL